MKAFIAPDFKRSNLNISASLAKFLGAPNKNATLPELDAELEKGYKNVVFMCLDGLGIHPMKKNLADGDFLWKNTSATLLSTFPSTTTNATTSLMLNQLPLEHGWFAWSMNFPKQNINVDIFLGSDSWSGEKVDMSDTPLGALEYYFDYADSEYNMNSVFPGYVKVAHPERNHVFRGEEPFFDAVRSVCSREGKQFIYAYYPEPDTTMHDHGVDSPEAKAVITSLSERVRELYSELEDTLIIVTADHGQVDIKGYVPLYEDEKLMDMLKIYPFLEARAPAFLVKEGREAEFEAYFTEKYGEDFELFKTENLITNGLFGDTGDKGYLLGDYIAIGTYTHKQAVLSPIMPRFKGHHTSLTEEMEVPLIILGSK